MTRLTSRLSIVLACQLFVGVGAAIAHCPEIHKACDRPIRTCQTNTDCSGTECAAGVCDTSVSTATRCFVTVTHAGSCTVDTQVNAAFDVQDFPSVADQRVPDAGNLPIVEVSGNAVCAAGPSLPCVIGPAGSTGNGLPGAGTPGLVSFASEHTLSAEQLQDLATAGATQLTDQATVTLQDLCTPGPECNATPTDLQVTATTPVSSGCSCPTAGVDLGVRKTADCVCGDDDDLTAALGTDGDVVVCGDDDDHSRTAALRDHGSQDDDDQGSNDDNDHGSVDDGSNDDGDHDGGSVDDGSHDGDHDDGSSDDGSSDDDDSSDDDGSHDGSPAGCTVGFTITVTNHGSETATNVVVSDTLPIGLLFVDSTASQGSFDPATGIWSVGTLAAGASATLTIHEDRGDDFGQCIENCAQVASVDQGDTNSTNDSDCVTVFTGKSDDGKSDDGHSADSDDDSGDSNDGKSSDGESHDGLSSDHAAAGLGTSDGTSDDSSDSASEDGPTCVPSDDHVCNEAVPAKWHNAFERWSKLVTKAAQAKSHRQAATSVRKAKVVLRRMQRITSKFERGGTVSDDCLGKLRSRLEALSTETRRIAG